MTAEAHAIFVASATSWRGTPYVHQGRTPGRALDCAGLFICAARESALLPADYDFLDYPPDPAVKHYEKFFKDFDFYGARVEPRNVQVGDVVLTGFRSLAKHIGIVTAREGERLRVVHAVPEMGVVEQALTGFERGLVARAYRFCRVWRD